MLTAGGGWGWLGSAMALPFILCGSLLCICRDRLCKADFKKIIAILCPGTVPKRKHLSITVSPGGRFTLSSLFYIHCNKPTTSPSIFDMLFFALNGMQFYRELASMITEQADIYFLRD